MAEEKQVREFKQTDDARAGSTGIIFRGQYYADEAALDAALTDKDRELRKGRGRGRMQGVPGALGGTMVRDPNKLPGRSGSGVEQTEDIVSTTGVVNPGAAAGRASSEDLGKLSKSELQDLAAAKGVEVKSGATKQEYIDALSGK